jgi:uncharacterized protein (DUF1697 family)
LPAGTYVALLRGINVGGKNKLPMRDLVALFEGAGCGEVRNYIQSGNIVFGCGAPVAKGLPAKLGREIEKRFGFSVPVILRTAKELADAVDENPFLKSGADIDKLHVGFLEAAPSKKAIDSLDPKRSPPDTFVVRGKEIYLSCPNGMGNTKLTNAYFDSRLATTSTMRNWKTVLKLLEMTGGASVQ